MWVNYGPWGGSCDGVTVSLGLLQWWPYRPSAVLLRHAHWIWSKPDIPPESSGNFGDSQPLFDGWGFLRGWTRGTRGPRGKSMFLTPVQPRTYTLEIAAVHAYVSCEFWRQKWHSLWGCKYGPSVWGNVMCLFQKAVAQQQDISEKETCISDCLKIWSERRGSEVMSLSNCQDHFHWAWAGTGESSVCRCATWVGSTFWFLFTAADVPSRTAVQNHLSPGSPNRTEWTWKSLPFCFFLSKRGRILSEKGRWDNVLSCI